MYSLICCKKPFQLYKYIFYMNGHVFLLKIQKITLLWNIANLECPKIVQQKRIDTLCVQYLAYITIKWLWEWPCLVGKLARSYFANQKWWWNRPYATNKGKNKEISCLACFEYNFFFEQNCDGKNSMMAWYDRKAQR